MTITAPLSVRELGFSLHAATRAGADDEKGREALLKYILRPPLATERLLPGPDGLVRIALKRPFSDGTVAIDLDPLSLLCRPPPRFHTIRYAGFFASASKAHRIARGGLDPPRRAALGCAISVGRRAETASRAEPSRA